MLDRIDEEWRAVHYSGDFESISCLPASLENKKDYKKMSTFRF